MFWAGDPKKKKKDKDDDKKDKKDGKKGKKDVSSACFTGYTFIKWIEGMVLENWMISCG